MSGNPEVDDLLNDMDEVFDTSELIAHQDARPESLHTLWELSEQGRVKLHRDDVTPELVALAELYAHEQRRLRRYLDRVNDFVVDVGENGSLTDGQAKGVLNVLVAQIRGQRKRWHFNNGTGCTKNQCIVCGLGVSADGWSDKAKTSLGVGTKCWSRLLGNWS